MKRLTKRSITFEMDRNVRQMLKLIEDDGDSFAQKAEMYYQKRPELISLVEEFYRGYRFLAERYEHATGELGKNMHSDSQSQASCISDTGSEPPSSWPSPSPRKVGRRISSNRAAGFDFFLGSGGNNNAYDSASQKDGDVSSTLTDSDEEFDDASSFNSCSGFFANASEHSMNRRVMELEIELREMKEKLCIREEERVDASCRGGRIENAENNVRAKINAYEQELRYVNDKLRLSEKEISKLKAELEKWRAMEPDQFHTAGAELPSTEEEFEMELRFTKEKLESSETEIASLKFEASKSSESIQQLQDQLNLAQKESASWKTKFNSEKRESTKLQETLAKLKTSLVDRDHDIRDLKGALTDAEQKIFCEKAQVKSEMSKLMEKQTHMEEKVREWEIHCQSLQEKIRKIYSEKIEMEEILKGEIEQLKEDNSCMKNSIKDLNESIDALTLERDDLNAEVGSLKEVLNSRDNQIEQMDMNLKQLHMEHVQLIAGMEEAQRQVRELKARSKELEEEIERQRVEILEGAEEKREAIRQLCFSLEHYRNGYNKLREAFIGHKRVPVLAT